MLEVLDAMCGGNKVRRKNVYNGLARWQWEQNLVSNIMEEDELGEGGAQEARPMPHMPTSRGH
jgi:hypothetical protein